MNEPLDPHLPADASHGRRELDVHILVGEVAGLDAPPHEVDDNVGVLDGPADGVLVLDFVGTEEDLAQVPNNLQERRERGSILIPKTHYSIVVRFFESGFRQDTGNGKPEIWFLKRPDITVCSLARNFLLLENANVQSFIVYCG